MKRKLRRIKRKGRRNEGRQGERKDARKVKKGWRTCLVRVSKVESRPLSRGRTWQKGHAPLLVSTS